MPLAVSDRAVRDIGRGAVERHALIVGGAAIAHEHVIEHAAAVVARVGEVNAPPIPRSRPGHAIVVVRVPTVGVIAQRGEHNAVLLGAVGHQGPVHRQVGAGVLELDDRPRLQRQRRAGVDCQPALDHVGQVGIPGLVEAHVPAHTHAVHSVVVGLVARKVRVARGIHIDSVAAVAPNLIVRYGWRRGAFQADAPAGVVEDPVAGHRRAGVVAGVDAVASVLVDDVIVQRRRGGVDVDRAAAPAAVAYLRIAQLRLGIDTRVVERDASPISRRWPGGCTVAVRVTADAVVIDRGECDVALGCALSIEDAVDRQVLAGLELDDDAWVDRQPDPGVDRHVADDDVGAVLQRPGAVGGDGSAHLRRAGRGR